MERIVEKTIALAVSLLTLHKLWLSNQKAKLENEKLKLEIRRIRRGN
ncbi:hypothetical protein [Gottschalkia purinilytica]|nr:hypothetical protein [Gottschalkia purinilytica]